MTGFGRAEAMLVDYRLGIDLKSLNSKSLDISVKIPNKFKEKEFEIRKKISDQLIRGKIEVYFSMELLQQKPQAKLNQSMVLQYMEQLSTIVPQISQTEALKMAIKMPEALQIEANSIDENEFLSVMQLLDQSLIEINEHRSVEGNVLKLELLKQVAIIVNLLEQVEPYEHSRIEQVKLKYKNALIEFDKIDEQRYYQEIVYYVEKLDISEEKVRLSQHCKYFEEVIETEQYAGKKLGFIAQEIGREINTLGSKANHSEIQKIVVAMKDSLEKIKEQLLNVL